MIPRRLQAHAEFYMREAIGTMPEYYSEHCILFCRNHALVTPKNSLAGKPVNCRDPLIVVVTMMFEPRDRR